MWCGCGEVIRGPHQQVQWCRHRMGSGVQGAVEMYGVIRNVLTLFTPQAWKKYASSSCVRMAGDQVGLTAVAHVYGALCFL